MTTEIDIFIHPYSCQLMGVDSEKYKIELLKSLNQYKVKTHISSIKSEEDFDFTRDFAISKMEIKTKSNNSKIITEEVREIAKLTITSISNQGN